MKQGEVKAPRPKPGASGRTGAAGPPGPAGASASATLLAIGLAVLAAVRLVLAFAPSAWFWGFHVQAYLAPVLGAGLGIVALAAVAPPVARPIARALAGPGAWIGKRPWLAAIGLGIPVAALVLGCHDALQYVGDSLLRTGAVRGEESPAVLSPQAFPLDLLIHYTLPVRAVAAKWTDAAGIARAIGAIDAVLLAGAGVILARALAVGAAGTFAAFAVAVFGGALGLMTGESKAFSEMVVVEIGFAGCALLALRGAREAREPGASGSAAPGAAAMIGAGVFLAIGVFLHRLSLGLIPAWLLFLVLWTRAAGTSAWRPGPVWAGAILPVAALAAMGPRLFATALAYDVRANFATPEVGGGGGLLGATLAPLHLMDVVNQLAFLSPVALAAIPAGLLLLAGERRRDEWLVLGALALPNAAVLLMLQPPQGPLRDWEAYAPPAAALSAAAAWAVARTIERSRREWLAAAVALGAMVPSVQWLAHFANRPRGLDRLEAIMTGPPERSAVDRATTWDFVGWKRFGGEDYESASRAFERAVDAAPSARHLTDWAMAETMRGDHARALGLYTRAVERDSTYRNGWFGVGFSGINSGHPEQAVRAVRALSALDPDNPKTRELADWVRQWQGASQR